MKQYHETKLFLLHIDNLHKELCNGCVKLGGMCVGRVQMEFHTMRSGIADTHTHTHTHTRTHTNTHTVWLIAIWFEVHYLARSTIITHARAAESTRRGNTIGTCMGGNYYLSLSPTDHVISTISSLLHEQLYIILLQYTYMSCNQFVIDSASTCYI